jgi:hypothetical protein
MTISVPVLFKSTKSIIIQETYKGCNNLSLALLQKCELTYLLGLFLFPLDFRIYSF